MNVWGVVLISEKKKKRVRIAEKQKSEPSKAPAPVPEVVIEEPKVTVEAPKEQPQVAAPSIMDILQTTDPKMLQTAQQLGIPLKPLMEWAVSIEAQVKAQSQALETLGVKLTPLINLAERAQQMQAHPTPEAQAPPAGNLGSILQLLPAVLGSGGGSSEMQDKIMNMALESMGLGNALVRAIIIKTAPELASQLLPPLAPPK